MKKRKNSISRRLFGRRWGRMRVLYLRYFLKDWGFLGLFILNEKIHLISKVTGSLSLDFARGRDDFAPLSGASLLIHRKDLLDFLEEV